MLVCSAAEQAMFVMALRDFVHCLMLSESPQAKLARTRLPEDAEGRTSQTAPLASGCYLKGYRCYCEFPRTYVDRHHLQ